MKHYIALTIGPIYKTLSNAKKTQELWASSYLFSYLMKEIIRKLTSGSGAIPYNRFVVPYVDQKIMDASTHVGLFHDRFIYESQNEKDLKELTAKIGFKFFWSPQDKLFLHPGAFLFFSPQGRLIRILYPPQAGASDVELAVLDAKQGNFRPTEIINFAVSLCYSYNFKEGKYTLSIPIFVGFGALFIGVFTMIGSITVFKRRQRKISKEGNTDDAQAT